MNYWVLKGNPGNVDWTDWFVPGRVFSDTTARSPNVALGDRVFFWKSRPTRSVAGLGTVSKRPRAMRNGHLEVFTRIQTPEFVPSLPLDRLRRVSELKGADFTKVGPIKIFYAITPVQARALMDLCLLNSRQLKSPWREMANLSGKARAAWRQFSGSTFPRPLKPPPNDPTAREQIARRVRAGAPAFRRSLVGIYNAECAISGSAPLCVLDACHLDSHATTGNNDPSNGLLLRADIHNLFDEGLLRIHPLKSRVYCAPLLRDTIYWRYNGLRLRRPRRGAPSIDALRARWDAPRGGWKEA